MVIVERGIRDLNRYGTRTKLKFRILQLLSESPADKIRIKYEAGLSAKQMIYYMRELIKDEFVEYVQYSRVYRIREKGRKLLEMDSFSD